MIVSGITAEQVTLRTPCPGYDVAGLIDHMVEAAYRAAALGRGRTPPAGDDSPHVELADAPAQLRRAAEEAAFFFFFSAGPCLGPGVGHRAGRQARPSPRSVSPRRGASHGQTGVPRHGGNGIALRGGGSATSRCRRLGTPCRLHGTRPAGIA